VSFSRAKTDGWVDGVDRLTAAQLNTMDADVANGIDAVQGGTVAVSNTFAHLYLNNSAINIASSGALTAVIPWYYATKITEESGAPDFQTDYIAPRPQYTNAWYQAAVGEAAQSTISFVCKAPHGCLLNGATAYIFPTVVGRAALPSGMPTMFVTTRNTATYTTEVGVNGSDLSLNVAGYETMHAVSANGLAHTFDAVCT